jgi:hypothetical protein
MWSKTRIYFGFFQPRAASPFHSLYMWACQIIYWSFKLNSSLTLTGGVNLGREEQNVWQLRMLYTHPIKGAKTKLQLSTNAMHQLIFKQRKDTWATIAWCTRAQSGFLLISSCTNVVIHFLEVGRRPLRGFRRTKEEQHRHRQWLSYTHKCFWDKE